MKADIESFRTVTQSILDGSADEETRSSYFRLLESAEELRGEYIEQMRTHAMLRWNKAVFATKHSSVRRRRVQCFLLFTGVSAAATLYFAFNAKQTPEREFREQPQQAREETMTLTQSTAAVVLASAVSTANATLQPPASATSDAGNLDSRRPAVAASASHILESRLPVVALSASSAELDSNAPKGTVIILN